LFGVPIDALTMAQAVERCRAAVADGEYLPIGVVNAAKVVHMRHDPQLRRAVTGCRMVLADGQSVVWASHLLHEPLPERVAGIDLFQELLAAAAQHGYRVYFLGARPEVLTAALREVTRSYPGITIAGARDGYFPAADERRVAGEIKRSRADLLFVGMSSPRKELFLSRWGPATGVRVAHGVGGSFDVLAGVTKRAPVAWQRSGSEWLYRLLQEPRRLGPRYVKTNLAFMGVVAHEVMSHRHGTLPARATDRQPERPGGLPAQAVAPAITDKGRAA